MSVFLVGRSVPAESILVTNCLKYLVVLHSLWCTVFLMTVLNTFPQEHCDQSFFNAFTYECLRSIKCFCWSKMPYSLLKVDVSALCPRRQNSSYAPLKESQILNLWHLYFHLFNNYAWKKKMLFFSILFIFLLTFFSFTHSSPKTSDRNSQLLRVQYSFSFLCEL
jgi:hypothetical protein